MADSIRKKYMGKIFRILKILLFSLVGIILVVALALQLPAVQNYIAGIAVEKLDQKLDTKISLGRIRITLPNSITLKDLYVEDLNQDTLLDAGLIKVNVGLFGLLRKNVNIHLLELHDITGRISRPAGDSAFNFSFIPEAFSSGADHAAQDTSSGSGMNFTLGRIKLSGINLKYDDALTGNRVSARIGIFSVHFRDFSLDPLLVDVGQVVMDNSFASMYLAGGSSSDESSAPDIRLSGRIILNNTGFHMEDRSTGSETDIRHARLTIYPGKVNLKEQVIHLNRIQLKKTLISMNAGTSGSAPKDTGSAGGSGGFNWDIKAGKIVLDENEFIYDVDTVSRTPGQVNFSHLRLRNFSAGIEDVEASEGNYNAEIKKLGFTEGSGFILSELKGKIAVSDTEARITGLQIKTPNSIINNHLTAHFSSLEGIVKDSRNTTFDIVLEKSRISPRDLVYFSPEIAGKLPASMSGADYIRLSADLEGHFSDFDIHLFSMGAGDNLALSLNGNVKGLPDMKEAYFRLSLDTLKVERKDIYAVLPDSAIPSSIHLPEKIRLEGRFEGSMADFTTGFDLHSSQGNISAGLTYKSGSNKNTQRFSGHVTVNNYDLGALLGKTDTLGKVSLQGKLNGSSRNFKNPDATFDFHISRLTALNYTYHDISLAGNFANRIFNGSINISDTSLLASFTGEASLNDTVPSYDFTLNVEGMDARAIHLTDKDIRVRGTVRTDFTGGNIDSINGYLKAWNLMVVRDGNFYPLDSVVVKATNSPGNTQLNLNSQFINANYEGTVRFSELPGMIRDYLNYYFDREQDTLNLQAQEGKFDFKARIYNTDLLSEVFVPDLNNFIRSEITASYDGSKPSFELTANFPEIDYNGLIVDTLRVNVTSGKKQIDMKAMLGHFYAPPLEIPQTLLTGTISHDTVQWDFAVKGKADSLKYHIAGYMESRDQSLYIGFDSSNLVLNNTAFSMPAGNYIRIGEKGFSANNIEFRSGDQKLELVAGNDREGNNELLKLIFSRFNINNLAALVSGDKEIINAQTNGDVTLKTSSVFNSDLTFSDVSLFGERVFNTISLKADNARDDHITLSAKFKGDKDNLSLSGNINSGTDPAAVDIHADIGSLNLASYQPFFPKQVDNLNGILSGKLDIVSKADNPEISGFLAFSGVSVTPSFTGSEVRFRNDRIVFNKRIVRLNNFTLEDAGGNTATLNGTIDATELQNPRFDLNMKTPAFQLLNTGKESRNMIYGKLTAGINARLSGDLNNPDILLNIDLDNDSHFYYMLPQAGTASIEQQGVVEFMHEETDTASNILTHGVNQGGNVNAGIKDLNLRANISIKDNLRMTIIVDPASGEELDVRGSGNLSFDLKGNGQMTLTGSYQVEQGSYNITLFNVMKRQFEIDKGSSLTWTGDVTDPQINLTTLYSVNTSPQPIILPQMTGASRSQDSRYSQNMDFNVYMYIKESLMQPSISFAIRQPASERDANIEARLSQLNNNESELNKQVFSLLLFNSFFEESPSTQNSLAYNLNSTARKGVGNLLAQQINRFSQEYIPGLNFNVNINSYQQNETGNTYGNTNVEMNVSKKLLNNRLSIRVGGNVNIRENNPNTAAPGEVNNLAGDVVVEYSLTPDGVYRVQAFKKNEYEDVIEGELNKTGLAFIFNRDFYSFRNLFSRNDRSEKGTANENKFKASK